MQGIRYDTIHTHRTHFLQARNIAKSPNNLNAVYLGRVIALAQKLCSNVRKAKILRARTFWMTTEAKLAAQGAH